MYKSRNPHAHIEPLEARIAPALAVLNPLADLIVGPGKTGADIDLSRLFDPIISDNGHTIVTLHTNFDSDPDTAGIQGDIVIEMLDDEAPLSVQNFLSYLANPDPNGRYDGTIFHRLFDFAGSAPGIDIIQGGGFQFQTPGSHIPTPFDVHNEYSADFPNTRGTLAMAKTALGPNTGSSEWFINTSNNESILGADNNGGFAVFGRVLQGMAVVDAIAALTTFNFSGFGTSPIGAVNGAFSDLPLQKNYNADPDDNPNTAAPLPTAANYVRLTGYEIQQPPSGTLTGVTYSVIPSVDIVDATTGLTSDLVSATVNGSTLRLNYKAHAAGVVRVTVHGTDATSSAEDTFTVNLQPNLVANFEQDPFDGIIIGGDTKTATIVVGNNGGGWAVGNVNVKVYLSKIRSSNPQPGQPDTGADPNGVLLQPSDDILFAEFPNQLLDLAGGSTLALTKTLGIPRQLVTTGNENYRILVEVTPSDSTIDERFDDDNVALDSRVHVWENRFGTFTINGFGTRTDAQLVYDEADGDRVRISMTKSGNGLVSFDGTLVDLAVVSPRPASTLTASIISAANVGGRDIDLHNVELLQYIRTVNLQEANLTGALSANEGFRELTMGDLVGPGVISVGRLPSGITINPSLTFGDVADMSIESLAVLRLIRADKWVESDGTPNRIDAPGIGNIAIRGNLEASVGVTTSRTLGVFYVGGFFKDSTLATKGNVTTAIVGGLDHANIFIGTTARPDSATDFAQDRTLGSLIVTGIAGEARVFISANVAAAHMGSVSVRGIDAINSPSAFGIVADSIRSYTRTNGPSSGSLHEPQRFDGRGRYSLTIV